MKKLISRVCCLCCVVLVLAACLPLSAFAVDPVSAGVIANSFAQAIAAYGASNGVAMTFDVANTDGIGESVHELWKEFRSGTQDADDYATLAAALFPELYYKASSVVGGVADVYTVGYNISSTYAEEFDNFFDWLLSGPAEMVKVDNQYYQFSSSQIGSNASSINVISTRLGVWSDQPINAFTGSDPQYTYDYGSPAWSSVGQYGTESIHVSSNASSVLYCFVILNSVNSISTYWASLSSYPGSRYSSFDSEHNRYNYSWISNVSQDSVTGLYYNTSGSYTKPSSYNFNIVVPQFSSLADALSSLNSYISSPSFDSVGVKASTNTGVAQFPDTSDPNYEAVGKQIPSTVPWDNSAYGDGTGTLTDAQSGAIAAGADTVIAQDGVLDLVESDEISDEPGTDDPPSTDPDDYAVPGLAEIFPFCIPFDIYNFLSALSAQPVAPHFTATLDFPEAVGGTQTIDIDFDSPTWNQLAQLLRLLELLAFIIGLALLTRSMFLRG